MQPRRGEYFSMISAAPVDLTVKARYSDDADAMFDRARSFADLIEATRRISRYDRLPAEDMEPGRTYETDIRIFGMFRSPDYQIRVDALCDETRRIETSEGGKGVRSWRHVLEVHPDGSGSVWIDRVTIDAGAMTPVIARYARFMYRHRHTHRRALEISASLRPACRPANSDLPIFHPVDHRS
ncbi:MAG: hypothetical protein EP307_10160 [Rhodobacteraceae bacterium]|nr:MAG: hypothetical protein EP307_10160 [Paracoccaceae bacterium]